ncbi:AraC family transcriptional regulator ligand-binding domain-containing protein [Paracoccus sp. Z330]|uniref:AraC family transcriptional regulator ligand-binding domain-containing protein n=1 Tax=Paracoccus onchidii TaxID=3017813 RepID=A0ABT4ZCJ4_9RHOB|nr:AraC family transcriptional regulator [Paracoccus onchidii]MDB6176370.1 AraC family transcriptional regulator ligand-binding domain-containing protein [Paracoccus onchidii]
MVENRLYKIAAGIRHSCSILGISPARVLARCGLDAAYLDLEANGHARGVDAAGYFRLWSALAEESDHPELPLALGQGASKGPFQPALLACSSSPDIYTGLNRLQVFKALIAPIRLDFIETANSFSVRFESVVSQPIPEIMAASEIAFFLDFARAFTAHPVQPLGVTLPGATFVTPAYQSFVAAPITQGAHAVLTFAMEDARRPLISADADLYQLVATELTSRLRNAQADAAFVPRVRRVLTELLPTGQISAEQVASRLGISKRSLQRRLKDEGTTFRHVLDETRAELSLIYLRDRKLSTEETSFLLAYQDPNSFYRAFHEWTGMTPAQARNSEGAPRRSEVN